ncbi:hypothetical protein Hydth_0428 [Hydrogenobacter thermophilus TK-6]|uniref:Uncharacterized protein n=1 Tax=Hydrogenobacter thermophilus (strain DSM 6534 / IAM 12695 / TK-6) TaxID=608538 RepID=D3DGE1_HYDTT|nr:hypothetical protein [Hydrogenobacter thermophilus]ADO44829.1 hypothetical protein Hydth_0428 [Hydrogenobacter thermophilus TK-6]BAI68893.1 hypothetical protein HTH_0429 [Hydrogenobacter thermophilus TK-6]
MKRHIHNIRLLSERRVFRAALSFIIAGLFFIGFYYGVYKPFQKKKQEMKSLYEERKKLRDELRHKAQELKSLMKEEEKINDQLSKLKDKVATGGDENTIVEQVKALISDKARAYKLTETSFSKEEVQDINGVKKIVLKAGYTSNSVESILRFLKDIEASGIMIESLSLGIDNPSNPSAYYVELRVYKLWMQR